jgi:hypothetical protein
VDQGTVTLQSTSSNNETLWSGEYTLPALPTPLPPLRLVVREYELFPGSGEAVSIAPIPATRLVYAEVLDVLLPG